jgi:hypothetical protein
MTFLYWNIRGVQMDGKEIMLKTILCESQAILFGLVETFHRNTTGAKILWWLENGQNVSYLHRRGVGVGGRASTGLILGWSNNHFTKLHHEINSRWIYVEGEVQYPQPVKVSIMLVYVPSEPKFRKEVFDAIEDKLKLRRAGYPFMVMGDFNEILEVGDRKGCQRSTPGMKAFREWVFRLQLRHIPLINKPKTFTCYSKNAASWLDRVFIEGTYFPDLNVRALQRTSSDHRPLLIELSKDRQAPVCPTFSDIELKMEMIENEEVSKATAYFRMQNLRKHIFDWNEYILSDIEKVLSNVYTPPIRVVNTSTDARIMELYEILYVLNFEFRKVHRNGVGFKQLKKVGILLLEAVTEFRRKKPTWESNLDSNGREFVKGVDRLINDVDTLDRGLDKDNKEVMNSIDRKIVYLRLELDEADRSVDAAVVLSDNQWDLQRQTRRILNRWLNYRQKDIFIPFNNFQLFQWRP